MLAADTSTLVGWLPEASLAAWNSLDGSKILTIRRIATLIADSACRRRRQGAERPPQAACRASQARVRLGPLFYTPKIGAQLTPHTTYPNATVLATVP